jgi:ribose transport system substrate-binding protein
MNRFGKNRLVVASTVLAAAALTLTACSSSSTSGSAASSSSAAPSAAVATAMKALAPYEVTNPTIKLSPLASKPPVGKTIDFLGCPVASCLEIQDAAQAAAAAVGWKIKVFNGGLTPATIISAMDEIVQTPNDGVLAIGILPNSAIQSQLNSLKSKNIPYVAVASASPIGGGMIANFSSTPEIAKSGKVMADWIVADSKAHAKIAYFWDPSLTQHLAAKNAFTSEISALCPRCSVDVQSTSFSTGIGTADPPQIVSYLQRNPNINYLVVGIGDATAGVPQALAAAGLANQVKIVTRLADTINFKAIQSGTETMGVTEETYEVGWRMIDVLARTMEGMSIADSTTPIGTIHVVTKAALPADLNKPYSVPNYEPFFLKAWHLN